MMNIMVENEVDAICKSFKFKHEFKNCNILVTGGTGLIGSYIIRTLSKLDQNIRIIGYARSKEKVKKLSFNSNIEWIYGDLSSNLEVDCPIDYIIHTASPTDSRYFIEKPVELINDTIACLNNVLFLAKKKKARGIVFLSSLEVYGLCNSDSFLKENEYYSIDCNNVRNSYSEGKKILECLCSSYAQEYDVPVKIVRLCQTFGPGVDKNDNRVFAQFAKSIVNNQDIVLSTKGETKRSYCSIKDAIIGIFIVLLFGTSGESYNLASDNSYFSIYEMAEMFITNSDSKIVVEEKDNNQYLDTIKFGLDTTKIKKLGFKSIESLPDMVANLIEYFKYIQINKEV